MQPLYGSDEIAKDLLTNAQVWAVVGLGQDESRAAFGIAKMLQERGKTIVPIHPRGLEVLGETGYTSLAQAKAAGLKIDVVDCFVASSRVGEVIDQAIELELPALWLQLEVIDEAKAAKAIEHGLKLVMNRCPGIDWFRLMGDQAP